MAQGSVKFRPPPLTKVGITVKGGFYAEMHWFLVGLDIEAKARTMKGQIRGALGDTLMLCVLSFSSNGSAAEDHTGHNLATVDFRVFAQAKGIAALMPNKFLMPMMDLIMCAYLGGTVRGPLGWLVRTRSGDKGSNANVRFWVRHEDEYE